MKRSKLAILAVIIVLSLVLSACRATDVVGRYAASSFQGLMADNQDRVYLEEGNSLWMFTSPGGEKIGWSSNFKETSPDMIMEIDADPFIAAGLNPNNLPEEYVYNSSLGKITIVAELGEDKFEYDGDATASAAFEKIIYNHRMLIGYHAPMDHFGVGVGAGNAFEWAKDPAKNDKDIVFILNPRHLIEAGVDPKKVEGWAYAEVEVKMGMMEHKFLKPYDLK